MSLPKHRVRSRSNSRPVGVVSPGRPGLVTPTIRKPAAHRLAAQPAQQKVKPQCRSTPQIDKTPAAPEIKAAPAIKGASAIKAAPAVQAPAGARPPPERPFPTWLPENPRHWDAMWVPAERPELSTMPVKPNCSEITDDIYLGNMLFLNDVDRMKQLGITHVLTLTKREVPKDVKASFVCEQTAVSDTPQTMVSQFFERGCSAIRACIEAKGRIFVHCRAGVSRASCFVIAYLMRHQGMSLRAALALVKSKRPIAHPNKGFLMQLMKYEEECHGRRISEVGWDELPYTLWERVSHLGLNDPIPSLDLSKAVERHLAAEYERRYGRCNPYCSMDAGLGGKMELHVVQLYSCKDFAWMDSELYKHLYWERPKGDAGNYVSRRLPPAQLKTESQISSAETGSSQIITSQER